LVPKDHRPPIGNGLWRIIWLHDSLRHVTRIGHGHDPNISGAHYLDNSWRYRLGCNGEPTGSNYLWIKWSCDWWRHINPVLFGLPSWIM